MLGEETIVGPSFILSLMPASHHHTQSDRGMASHGSSPTALASDLTLFALWSPLRSVARFDHGLIRASRSPTLAVSSTTLIPSRPPLRGVVFVPEALMGLRRSS